MRTEKLIRMLSIIYRKSTMVDAAVLEKLESGFKKLKESNSKSLLNKYLTQELFDQLKTKKTPTFGSTLLDVIQSGEYQHQFHVSEESFLKNSMNNIILQFLCEDLIHPFQISAFIITILKLFYDLKK